MDNTEKKILDFIHGEMEKIPGHLGLYYKNLVSGFEYSVRENEDFLAASVIKFPIFLHIVNECEKGNMSMDDILTTENDEKVPGCGAVKMFSGELSADIGTLCNLMICISDNTATNRLIRHCTMEVIEKGFIEMGLEKTKLRRKLFDSEASSRGIENTICPGEMGMLLEKLYKGEFINAEKSKEIMDVLFKQQINHKMGGKLKDVSIAHKTGEDYMLSNDVGIVYADEPFVLCFAGHDTDVYMWENLMRIGTYELAQAVKK